MRNYYLFKAEHLHRHDETLEIVMNDGNKRSLPIEQTDALYIFNTMTLTTSVLELLSKKEIPVHFFNYYEFYTGSFYPKEHNVSGRVLLEQVRAYESDKGLSIAREFIRAGLTNIKRNMVYYNNRNVDLSDAIIYIEQMIKKVETAENTESLMGYEGSARKRYYSEWHKIIVDYNLNKRVRRPPTDIVNVLVSFFNSMLYTTCLGEIYKTQLNPTISFLHQLGRKKFALSLDISEIFKPILVDRLIFRVLNKNIISDSSFYVSGSSIVLKEDTVKRLLKLYDDEINQTIVHRKLNRKVSYKSLIKFECYKIIKALLDDDEYKGFTLDW